IAFFFITFADAQTKKITGKLTGPDNTPLAGVTVQVKGVNRFTTTSSDGVFTIEAPENAKTLVFSYTGMETQEVSIAGKTNVQVQLNLGNDPLSGVMVIGYGTVKKSDLTGSVVSVNADAISKRKVTTLNQALMGQMAGVQVELNDATPGGTTSIRV